MNKHIFAPGAPSTGLYSHAVLVSRNSDFLFLAGQTGNIPDRKKEPVVKGGVGPQTTQTLQNIVAVLEAGGMTVKDLVVLQVLLKDPGTPEGRKQTRLDMNAAYKAFFQERGMKKTKTKNNLPARLMAWVPELPLEFPTEDTEIEILAIAAKK